MLLETQIAIMPFAITEDNVALSIILLSANVNSTQMEKRIL
jgi:hypothetical protein